MTPGWVRLTRRWRSWKLRREQRIEEVQAIGLEHLRAAREQNQGLMITPNHSVHYDSAALYLAADQADQPLYFLTAWQVFAMSNRLECWAMQRLGCFSIDRESSDRQAFKQSVQVLQQEPHPLVIFPEGDIYHVSDRVTPFREGAAAIALAAAKRAERPLAVVPCGIKFWYIDDPTRELEALMLRLEETLYLRPQRQLPLWERIYRFAEALMALKELDYLGHTQAGALKDRIALLSNAVLAKLENERGLSAGEQTIPERVKTLRKAIISELESEAAAGDEALRQRLQGEMEDVFFVIQLFSYPGNYLRAQPTIERLAETLDKFEEDVLQQDLPSVRGRRRAVVEFGEPIPVPQAARSRDSVLQLTRQMQQQVQSLLDKQAAQSNGHAAG